MPPVRHSDRDGATAKSVAPVMREEYPPPMSHQPRERISRRRVLAAGTAGVVGAAAALTGHAQTADTTRVQGPGTTDVGARSPFVTPKRQSFSPRRTASTTPLQDLEGIITPEIGRAHV